MHLRVSAPGNRLTQDDVDRIHKDLQKIDRRLARYDEVYAEVRISGSDTRAPSFDVTLQLEYSRHHLTARSNDSDVHQAVRNARDDIMRQINDHSRGGHSSFSKRR